MKRTGLIVGGALVLAVLYLLAWPVPVDPVAWEAPEDQGLTGKFAANDMLAPARGIDLGEHDGPEDIALGTDGNLYATTHGGAIIRISPGDSSIDVLADPGGRSLGIETDADGSLLIANAYTGIQRVAMDGTVTDLVTHVDGTPLVYADDVAVAGTGKIYFSEASTKFGAEAAGGTLEGSLLDMLEHGANGFIAEHDPATGETRIIIDDLNFANGVAVSEDDQFLLVAETGSYRILKHWLEGEKAGTTEVLIDNLPGFPDNINNGLNGRFWIGLVNPRNEFLDRFAGSALIRKIAWRLPPALRPKPVMSSHVFAIDGDGEVLMNLQDPAARFPMTTGALETRDAIYVTTLIGRHLPVLLKVDLL